MFVDAFHEVPVSVDSDLDAGVAEPCLDRLWVFTFCDELSGVGVTQIVNSAWFADGRCDGCTPGPSEGPAAEKRTGLGGPDGGVGWGIGVEMMIEGVDDDVREGDGAFGGRSLRRAEDWWLSGGFDVRCIDGESPPVHVDIGDLEAGEFSPSQSGVGGDGCE